MRISVRNSRRDDINLMREVLFIRALEKVVKFKKALSLIQQYSTHCEAINGLNNS